MDICVTSVNPTGCGHYDVTVTVDGVPVSVPVHESDLDEALTAEEQQAFVRVCLRRLRARGVTAGQLVGRVSYGEEATNVKSYDLIGPGATVTKTNIGTTYVDVLPGANGQRVLVDFTGCTQYLIAMTANLVGTGPFGLRLVRDSDNFVIHESASIALTGERELDTGWQTLPVTGQTQVLVRLQARSTVAQDDPVFRRATVLVR